MCVCSFVLSWMFQIGCVLLFSVIPLSSDRKKKKKRNEEYSFNVLKIILLAAKRLLLMCTMTFNIQTSKMWGISQKLQLKFDVNIASLNFQFMSSNLLLVFFSVFLSSVVAVRMTCLFSFVFDHAHTHTHTICVFQTHTHTHNELLEKMI